MEENYRINVVLCPLYVLSNSQAAQLLCWLPPKRKEYEWMNQYEKTREKLSIGDWDWCRCENLQWNSSKYAVLNLLMLTLTTISSSTLPCKTTTPFWLSRIFKLSGLLPTSVRIIFIKGISEWVLLLTYKCHPHACVYTFTLPYRLC